MKRIAITQRVEKISARGERRDCLDQRWTVLLSAADLQAVALPNEPALAARMLEDFAIEGIVFSGGNSLCEHGGDAPERDATERLLLNDAEARALPVVGICRGMQMLQTHLGDTLEPVFDHVMPEQRILIDGKPTLVNSFHTWGTRHACPGWSVWARSEDGVVKAIRHRRLPWIGIMWHPERIAPFRAADLRLLRQCFATETA